MSDRAAVFVVPGTTAGQLGPVASLVSAAGWAGAARRVLGRAWIVTPTGVLDPDDARRQASAPHRSSDSASWGRRLPIVAKTALKDVRQWRRARRFGIDPEGPWRDADLAFVWQRHELFHTAGIRLARALGVPAVLFVPATLVWEAEQWDVARPGWARWIERRGEQPSLRTADLVACGSAAIAEQALRLGVAEDRIIVTPTGVELDLFDGTVDPGPLRSELGLEGHFVVGWVGSFRRFHALEQVVEALAGMHGTTLLLVGDGPERARIERLARDLDVTAVCTGTVAQQDLPGHLAVMDVAVVLASADASFHYSPLKLAEYLAAGLAVVAPAAGQLPDRLTDGVDAVLVPPGDTLALRAALVRLRDDPVLRRRLGQAARASAAATWSWDHQVRRVADALR